MSMGGGVIKFCEAENQVYGIETEAGEKLLFDGRVKIDEKALGETLKQIHAESKKAVRCEIEKAVTVEGGAMGLFTSGRINQACIVADQIHFWKQFDEAKTSVDDLKALHNR